MPTYVTFFSYTSDAWKRMIDRPENRAVAARKLIEQVGGRMEVFYWMFGEWDGFAFWPLSAWSEGRLLPLRAVAAA